jgi:hypothetical protein
VLETNQFCLPLATAKANDETVSAKITSPFNPNHSFLVMHLHILGKYFSLYFSAFVEIFHVDN